MDSLFIGLELCEFCVFSDGIIAHSDCFEMKYELECYDILLSTKIDAAVNFNTIGIGSCPKSRMGCNSLGVLSPRAIKAAVLINENEMKYECSLSVPQPQTQSQHTTPYLAEISFNFALTGARSLNRMI